MTSAPSRITVRLAGAFAFALVVLLAWAYVPSGAVSEPRVSATFTDVSVAPLVTKRVFTDARSAELLLDYAAGSGLPSSERASFTWAGLDIEKRGGCLGFFAPSDASGRFFTRWWIAVAPDECSPPVGL